MLEEDVLEEDVRRPPPHRPPRAGRDENDNDARPCCRAAFFDLISHLRETMEEEEGRKCD